MRRAAASLLVALAIASSCPARGADLHRWDREIAEASRRFAIPADWIGRVIRAESGGSPTVAGRPITSRAGAMGLMQLMPGTWAEMRRAYGLGSNPYNPHDNILAGTAYLGAMYQRFGYPGLFAAYNAGPARYAEHLASGRPLPPETLAYVAAIGAQVREARAASAGQMPAAGLFVTLSARRRVQADGLPRNSRPARTTEDASLFVQVTTYDAASHHQSPGDAPQ